MPVCKEGKGACEPARPLDNLNLGGWVCVWEASWLGSCLERQTTWAMEQQRRNDPSPDTKWDWWTLACVVI